MFKRDKLVLALVALLSVLVLAAAAWKDYNPMWIFYQLQFRSLVAEKLGPEKAAAVKLGVQQIWLPEAGRVDRCVSCHQGVSWAGLEDAPEPYRSHPVEPLKNHPVEKFGCTFCHGGQGPSTILPDAHGWIKHWKDPLLDSKIGTDYQMKNPLGFMQIKCNVCHRYDRKIEGADYINRAKSLVEEKGCRACHTINERGGAIGPDLTWIGDKHAEQYDFSRLTTYPSVFSWQVGHLQDPKSFAPDTIMPQFGFSTEDSQALALLLLSWKKEHVPASLMPGMQLRDQPTPEEAEKERMMREGEGRFFVEKTCFVCHDVSSLGIFSATKIGPDLAIAVEDVPRRFGRTLEDFLQSPSGTMSVVLSKQIPLTKEERSEAARLLQFAYQKHLEQQNKPAEAPAAVTDPIEGSAAGTATDEAAK
ncbi:c-type cytochrome [bacterium]|nr:c-type cytochrome [bacterium]